MYQKRFHLVSHVLCPYVQRSVITLEEKGIQYTRSDIDLANKPQWFLDKSPMGKVPILMVDEDSRALFESAVICEYLDEVTSSSLNPTDILTKAYHRAWIEFGSSILNDIGALYNAKTEAAFNDSIKQLIKKFSQIEQELNAKEDMIESKPNRYFAGNVFHMIDAVYGPIFRYFDVFEDFINVRIFETLPKCQLWRESLALRPSVQNAVSEDYPERLKAFVINRQSYMSELLSAVHDHK